MASLNEKLAESLGVLAQLQNEGGRIVSPSMTHVWRMAPHTGRCAAPLSGFRSRAPTGSLPGAGGMYGVKSGAVSPRFRLRLRRSHR